MKIRFVPKRAMEFLSVLVQAAHINEDVVLSLNSEGIILRMMDPTMIQMLDVRMCDGEAIDIYKPVEDRMTIIDLSPLIGLPPEFLYCADLRVQMENGFCILNFDDRCTLTLPMIKSTSSLLKAPIVPFKSDITVMGHDFKRHLRAHLKIGNHVELGTLPNDNKLYFTTELDRGQFKSSVRCKIRSNELGGVSSNYDLSYLDIMVRGLDGDQQVGVELGNDCPVKLTYYIGKTRLIHWLSPRIGD